MNASELTIPLPRVEFQAQRETATGWMRKRAILMIKLVHLDHQCRKRKPSS